jgi:hypothetical protein
VARPAGQAAVEDYHKERNVIDVSNRPSCEANARVEGAPDRGSRETVRPLKPTLVKPEGRPRKDFVDFYVPENF